MHRKIKEKKAKKAQEEMVGFVLIIILVAVIVLIFLAFSIRRVEKIQESKEIGNFLHSSLLYTTECKPSPERVYNFKDLVKACFKDERCLDGEETCEVLNETAFELIENSWQIGKEVREKAYIFKIYEGERNKTILYLSRGNQTSTKYGSEVYIPVAGDNLYVRLEIFY